MDKKIYELYDCKQSAFAYIFEQYGLIYQSVAIGKLLFQYNKDESINLIGERILPYRFDSTPVNNILGVDEIYGDIPIDLKKLDDYLEMGRPAIVKGDLFECKWSLAYKKYHFEHFWVIEEKYNNNYYFSDPYLGIYGFFANKEDLINSATSFGVYISEDLAFNPMINICSSVKEDAAYYLENNMQEAITAFAYDLCYCDLKKEKTCEDLYAISLLDNLKIVGRQRGAYACLFQFLKDDLSNNWNGISSKLNESMLLWDKLRVSLTKSIIKKHNQCDVFFVRETTKKIIDLENNVMREMLLL